MIHKIFFHSPIRYIVGVILALIIGFLCLLSKGFEYRISYVDAFSVSGAIVFFLGLLQAASFYGAFELFGYSFSAMRGKNRRYKDYYEYQQAKLEKRGQQELVYVPFIVVGVLFFITGMVLNLILL